MLRATFTTLFLFLFSTTLFAAKPQHKYTVINGNYYGYEINKDSILLISYLGQKDDIYQFVWRKSQQDMSIIIIKPPYEFYARADYYGHEFIGHEIKRLHERNIVSWVLQDAKHGYLQPAIERTSSSGKYNWINDNYQITLVDKTEFQPRINLSKEQVKREIYGWKNIAFAGWESTKKNTFYMAIKDLSKQQQLANQACKLINKSVPHDTKITLTLTDAEAPFNVDSDGSEAIISNHMCTNGLIS
ncbi:hypothetical protein [Neptuniibacter marinus]|uniref:hypothetical protein n=1 Tax=Neptuniibacter marinus TaxID=1806670 RepID=UPI003B5CC544